MSPVAFNLGHASNRGNGVGGGAAAKDVEEEGDGEGMGSVVRRDRSPTAPVPAFRQGPVPHDMFTSKLQAIFTPPPEVCACAM